MGVSRTTRICFVITGANHHFKMIFVLFTVWMHMQYQRASAMNCGAMLTNSSGWFASPDTDFDGEYEFNADCTWIIRVPDNKIIYIHFLEFDVEDGLKCGYDYLRIRDGNTKVGHYCGDTLPPDFVSTARLMFIDFHSDNFINKKGFNATYTEMDDPTCGYQTWSIAGDFGSFDTDIEYDCMWTITEQKHVPAIQVYIAKLNIGWTEGCDLYFLEVSSDTKTLGRFCGEFLPPPITSVSNVLYLHLRSSGNVKFLMYYCTTDVNATFGGILPDISGSFTATDYDHNGLYDHYANTIWAMVAPEEYLIRLDVFDIHIHSSFASCDGDSLKIYDGAFEVGTEIEEICGFFAPDRTIVSYNQVLFAHFLTNGYYSGTGFNATYKHIRGLSYTGGYYTGTIGALLTTASATTELIPSTLITPTASAMSTTAIPTSTEGSAATVMKISAMLANLVMITFVVVLVG